MAFDVSLLAERLSSGQVVEPQLILEIDGLPTLGATKVTKLAVYGEDGIYYGMPGLVYGGIVEMEDSRSYIDLGKSTNAITQQLLQDKGGASSVTNFKITLVDYQKEVSTWITPGLVIDEILARKARVYLAFQGGAHPRDSILIFNGIIGSIDSGAGFIEFSIDSPEQLKRAEIFNKAATKLNASINNSQTTIPVEDESDFIMGVDPMKTYVRIDDEVILVGGLAPGQLTGCTRAQLGTVASSHDNEADVESIYRLTGNLRDLALTLMLSGGDEYYEENTPITGFTTDGIETRAKTLYFPDYDIASKIGITSGDFLTVTGSGIPSNNVVLAEIQSSGLSATGSYITIDQPLTFEPLTTAVVKFKSRYNILPAGAGAGMTPDQVDVQQHMDLFDTYSSVFFEYDFYIKESEKAGDFISKEIYYPSGCYSLPRKGRSSVGFTSPPIAYDGTQLLNVDNVGNAAKTKVQRSVSKNFYNAVVYKYEESPLFDKFLRGKIRQSADSTERIKIANKPLTIESKGVRDAINVGTKIQNLSRRLLDRYQFGAESFEVKSDFKTGWKIECGDTVIFDGRGLEMTDTQGNKGTRDFLPRVMEVTNKSLNIKTGEVKLQITDTAFELDGRYGIIGPSSKLGVGSTTARLVLTHSYGTDLQVREENFKWKPYIGENVVIHSADWSIQYEATIEGMDPADDNAIFVSGLMVAPAAGLILDQAKYDTGTDPGVNAITKAVHPSFNAQISVLTGISGTQFTVSVSDALKIKKDYSVFIHNEDYSTKAPERTVLDVTGTTVTLDEDIGFTPTAGLLVDLLGYDDGGKPYRWL